MSTLKRAIGLVLGTIRAALPVRLTQTFQTGGNSNTVGHQHQRAIQESKPKRKRVQAVTRGQFLKQETLRAQTHIKKSSEHGTQPAATAPQPAPKKSKRSPSLAPSTTVAPLHKAVRKAAPAINGDLGKQLATPVFPILRPAKSKSKPKR